MKRRIVTVETVEAALDRVALNFLLGLLGLASAVLILALLVWLFVPGARKA